MKDYMTLREFINRLEELSKNGRNDNMSVHVHVKDYMEQDCYGQDETVHVKNAFEEITSIEYDEKEQTWYVHNYITSLDLMTNEYWTPLRDMSFDELFKISQSL